MKSHESLKHTKFDCKYHMVFIPKYRRKALYDKLREHLGEVFHDLAKRRESRIEQGNLVVDHVHMLISIPPKYAVSQVVGFIKGKSTTHIARVYSGRRKNFTGHSSSSSTTCSWCTSWRSSIRPCVRCGRSRTSARRVRPRNICRSPRSARARSRTLTP